ncbi:PREDICTED: nucleoporin GLE1-like [Acropora digitifera]|uniref:nucleoporin GLE1-like n=1 Tax=Acropora digitifera TaxID=70779 RepID=UPI000779FCDF|nr:PREDICTED: nucleoporin GLE1-like [Acropora digitifera]
MASLLREQTRIKESLESALERQKEEHNSRIRSMNNDFQRTLNEKDQELDSKVKALTLESTRYADMNELNQLQQQELTKMKSLFIQYQTDATRKAAEIIEKSKNLQLEQQLASLQKEANSGKRSSLEQRAQLEEQFVHLEEAREREKNEMKTKLDQLKMIENEYTRQEDYYKQQMADLEEEKEQLQVNCSVNVCEINMMFQIAKFEETLKEKNDLLTCFKGSKFDSPSHFTASNLDSQTLENLKEELQISQIRCQNAEESLEHREKTIIELRKTVAEKEELLNCSTTKVGLR